MLFYVFIILGVLSIIVGLIFMINPRLIIKLNEFGNKVIFVDDAVLLYPRVFGTIMLFVSLYLLYIGWKN